MGQNPSTDCDSKYLEMASRIVTGSFFKGNNQPFVGYQVWFTLKPGGFTVNSSYPRSRIIAIVGANGRMHPPGNPGFDGIELWSSEEATSRTEYRCQLPSGEIFEFELDAGTGPIDISTLRLQDSEPGELDPGEVAIERFEDFIDAHNSDPFAHPALSASNDNWRVLTVSQTDLIGAKAFLQHDLDTDNLDAQVSDPSGAIWLPWKPLGVNHIEVDFEGLTPLLFAYTVLIEGY